MLSEICVSNTFKKLACYMMFIFISCHLTPVYLLKINVTGGFIGQTSSGLE